MSPYWVQVDGVARMAIVPCPRGGDRLEDELREMRRAGIDVLVSMLTRAEESLLGLGDEGARAGEIGLEFVSFPVPDGDVPEDRRRFLSFLEGLQGKLDEGKKIGVHCRACVGRSAVVLASLLVMRGVQLSKAFELISVARGYAVPATEEQARWVREFAEQFR